MGLAIITNNTAAVNGKDNGQILEADIVDELVKGALQEGGIYGHDGYKTLRRQPGGKGNRMLLADSHVKNPLRKLSRGYTQIVSLRHSRGNRHQLRVLPSQTKHGLGEHLAVGWYILGSCALSGHAVKVNSVTLGRTIALTLGGNNMNKGWLGAVVPCLGQRYLKLTNVMPVNRADIGEAELLPEHGGHN